MASVVASNSKCMTYVKYCSNSIAPLFHQTKNTGIRKALMKTQFHQISSQESAPRSRRLLHTLQTPIQSHYSAGQSPTSPWHSHEYIIIQAGLNERVLYIETIYTQIQSTRNRIRQTPPNNRGRWGKTFPTKSSPSRCLTPSITSVAFNLKMCPSSSFSM